MEIRVHCVDVHADVGLRFYKDMLLGQKGHRYIFKKGNSDKMLLYPFGKGST